MPYNHLQIPIIAELGVLLSLHFSDRGKELYIFFLSSIQVYKFFHNNWELRLIKAEFIFPPFYYDKFFFLYYFLLHTHTHTHSSGGHFQTMNILIFNFLFKNFHRFFFSLRFRDNKFFHLLSLSFASNNIIIIIFSGTKNKKEKKLFNILCSIIKTVHFVENIL